MFCNKRERPNNKRSPYQVFFGIEDREQFLIYYTLDGQKNSGYVVFIDKEYDLDYIDKRDKSAWTQEEKQLFQKCLSKLQQAEVVPHINLSNQQTLMFKRLLGTGYLQILEKDFSSVDFVIDAARLYLRQRNIEKARQLCLTSAGLVALLAAFAGMFLFIVGNHNLWLYGILFGILGSYVSIWTRYGKEEMTGLAPKSLHYLESISRLFIGAISAVIAMFAIRSGLMLAIQEGPGLFFLYCILGFASGFSERFMPSLIEKLVSEQISR